MAADIERRTTAVIRHEFVLKAPAVASDVAFLLNTVLLSLPEARRRSDDCYRVEIGDDEIIAVWTEDRKLTELPV